MTTFRKKLSPKCRDILAAGPSEGGTHDWILRASACLSNTLLNADEAFEIIRRCCDAEVTHRRIPDREIKDHVAFAYGYLPKNESGSNPIRQGDFPCKSHPAVAGALADYEPICGSSEVAEWREALECLFNPGDLACIGIGAHRAEIQPMPTARDLEGYELICANPMKGKFGKRAGGELSVRCQDNIATRRHLVVEFDTEPDLQNQARLHSCLSAVVPCVLVVWSGGKSLHGWYNVEGMSLTEQAAFFSKACFLGADASLWDTCKWVRMPGGTRSENGKRQSIIYMDEECGVSQSDEELINKVCAMPNEKFDLAWRASDEYKKENPNLSWRECDLIAAAEVNHHVN
jgi:hypothetical protein